MITQPKGTAMSTMTLHDAETTYGVTYLDHLDRQATLPVVSGLAAQGDLVLVPAAMLPAKTATVPLPAQGVAIIPADNGARHEHRLLSGDRVFWDAVTSTGATIGVLTVPQGATALLTHEEHGGLIVTAGSYTARRQSETTAAGQRLVHD